MIRYISLLLFIGSLFGEDDFAGGYIGLRTQIGTDLTFGFQVSLGIIEPSFSEPGDTFLSPGVALGFRNSIVAVQSLLDRLS